MLVTVLTIMDRFLCVNSIIYVSQCQVVVEFLVDKLLGDADLAEDGRKHLGLGPRRSRAEPLIRSESSPGQTRCAQTVSRTMRFAMLISRLLDAAPADISRRCFRPSAFKPAYSWSH